MKVVIIGGRIPAEPARCRLRRLVEQAENVLFERAIISPLPTAPSLYIGGVIKNGTSSFCRPEIHEGAHQGVRPGNCEM
jgi:hypothetical protein